MINYYTKEYIKHLIRENTKDREVASLGQGNIRGLKIKNNFDIDRIIKLINWYKNKQNLYRGIARVSDIPEFTFNPKVRSSETIVWFQDEFDNLITTYDLFFDFDKDDNSTIYDVLKEVKVLLDFFEQYKVSYYVLFSGNKGFQVIVDGKYMPNLIRYNGAIQPHKKIVEKIKEAFDFKYLDLRNNGIPNRLCKIPYSLVGDNVALPLSKEQVDNFNVEDMKIENVLKKVKPLMRRGNLERFENLSETEKQLNMNELIKVVNI